MHNRSVRFQAFVLVSLLAVLAASSGCNSSKVSLVRESSLGKGIYRLRGLFSNSGMIWSPDGNYLAWLKRQMPMPECYFCAEPYSEIFLVNTQTWEKRSVLRTKYVDKDIETISWIPDSRQIVYLATAKHYDEKDALWSIGIDGKNDQRYLQSAKPDEILHWSPDGSKIAFLDRENVSGKWTSYLYVIDPETNEERLVYQSEAGLDIEHISWGADSRKIAFAYGVRKNLDSSGKEDIYLVDIESGAVTQVTDDPFDYDAVYYSPVHNLVVLRRRDRQAPYPDNADKFAIRDLERNCEIELPFADAYSASWSPDGQKLEVTANLREYIVDLTEFIGTVFRETGSICP